MRRCIILILGLLLPILVFSQIELNQHSGKTRLVGNDQVKAVYSRADEPFSTILKTEFSQNYDTSFVQGSERVLWLKFSALNTDTTSSDYFIFCREAYFSVYLENDTGWVAKKNGYLRTVSERNNKLNTNILKIDLPPYQPVDVYIRLEASPFTTAFSRPRLIDNLFHYRQLNWDEQYNLPGATFSLVYLSGLLIISFFVFILYFSVRERVYGYYLLYLIFQLIYALIVVAGNPLMLLNLINFPPRWGILVMESVQFVFIGFYIYFILDLLEVKKFDRLLSKIMRGLAWFCFAYALVSFGIRAFMPSPDLQYLLFQAVRAIILPLNLILIIWVILKVKHPLVTYFIIGNIFFYTGSVLSFYVSITEINYLPDSIFYFRNSLNTIFQMGLLGEVICFSFAVAHHVRMIYRQKEDNSEAYIQQLQENQRIQESMNKELDRKVNEKTNELIQVYTDIEKQREKEIKYEFSQKIKETEMLALRSQMNPHFLFNSMNAIKHLILTKRSKDAMLYLDNFAGLLRGVLQNSKRETITVEDEFELLELYISLEKGRLGPTLQYELLPDDKSELSQYPIPALLLQPFVENAIWHGLQPKVKAEKKLIITFDTSKNLVISIRDNGIGRDAAKKFYDENSRHKSFGIQITQERLALFNHLNDIQIDLEITDLMENGVPAGTLVTFTYSI